MKPKYKLGGTLCNHCNTTLSTSHTSQVLCDQCLERLVYKDFKTRYKEGYTPHEIKMLLTRFPDINMEKYYEALGCHTAIAIDGIIITYHCDVLLGINCGINNRDITTAEFD